MTEDKENGKTLTGDLLKGSTNIPTWILVVLMGGGNIFATFRGEDQRRSEIDRAIQEIHVLHDALNEFEQRQKDTVAKVTATLDGQAQILKNQTIQLENLAEILTRLHRSGQNFKNPEF